VPRTSFVPCRVGKEKVALLGDLISVLLAPYDEKGASVRIRVSVLKMNVGESSSTTLALVIHELATNSAKHGSLSVASGTLDVSCNGRDDEVVIMWTERGGPPFSAPATLEGLRQQTDTPEYGRATRELYRL
jgi:two-component sensor histidine kinase